MIRRLLLCMAFAALTLPSVGQNSPQPAARTFNNIYDSVIINDSYWPVAEYPHALPARDSLVYDPWISYENKDLKALLDRSKYTGKEKVNFIKAAISDSRRDIFSAIEKEAIEFWHTNAQAQLLMLHYFIKSGCDRSDDPKIHFRYFDFVTINALPGAAEMIEAYVKNRPSIKIPYPDEVKLVYRLIHAGSERSALDLLQVLVAEYPGDKGPDYNWGNRREDTNVFDLLCFSNNKSIRTEARQLLWTCLDKEINDDLFELGLYLDKKRDTQCLQTRFQYYTTVDLGKIEADKAASYKPVPPVVSSYLRFMWHYSRRLSNIIWKQLLAEVVNRMPYWDYYEGSKKYIYQTTIVEEAFKDSTLTEKERRQLLFDVNISGFSFNDLTKRISWSNGASRSYFGLMEVYSQLVRQAYPNGDIPGDDSTRLYLSSIRSSPYHSQTYYSNSSVNMAAAVADLNQLGLANLQLQPDLPDYWTFKWTLAPFNSYILPFLWKRDLVIHFDPPSRYGPAESYKKLFSLYFEQLLAKKGITDIDVQEISDSIPNKHLKKIFVRSNEAVYISEYIADVYGQTQIHKLAKMINLLLIKKNIKERLVEIERSEFTMDYGVFEPEKLKTFLGKNSVHSFELDNVSGLMN